MEFSLAGKVAIVTGASRGIGRGIALGYAEQGADVVITARSVDALAELKDEIESLGRRAAIVEADAMDIESAARPVQAAVAQFGRLDILVNNAGGAGAYIDGASSSFFDTPLEAVDSMLRLNVLAPVAITQAAAEHMKDHGGGCIINITSLVGMIPRGKLHAYSATKAAMGAFTTAWAEALGPYGIRVNAIAPGGVVSGNFASYIDTPEKRAEKTAAFPIGRLGEPRDAAACAIFLGSDEAGFVSGASILLSGARMW